MPPNALTREQRTIAAMIALYCRDHHHTREVCASCAALEAYARQRLRRCVFGAAKPTCAKCPIHCYRREMRDAMREVMRWAGPKMLLQHPFLALAHLVHGARPAPRISRQR